MRATAGLREHAIALRRKLPAIASGRHDGAVLELLVKILDDVAERVATAPALGPLETSDLEDAVTDWLDEHDVGNSWQLAPPFVQAGIGPDKLDRIAAAVADAAGDRSDGELAGALALACRHDRDRAAAE